MSRLNIKTLRVHQARHCVAESGYDSGPNENCVEESEFHLRGGEKKVREGALMHICAVFYLTHSRILVWLLL